LVQIPAKASPSAVSCFIQKQLTYEHHFRTKNQSSTDTQQSITSHSVNTEFSEARHRLLPDSPNLPALDKAARTVRNRNGQHQVFADSQLVDEAFYWFLTAPALVYVVYLAFGL
jgi:hypothetical protein